MKRCTVLSATRKRRAATTGQLPTVDLPAAWLDELTSPSEVFGDDYCGPLIVESKKRRGCHFTCMPTKHPPQKRRSRSNSSLIAAAEDGNQKEADTQTSLTAVSTSAGKRERRCRKR